MHRRSRRVCEPPEWAWSGRPRVLVEGPDAWAWRGPLEDAGFEVADCRGPDTEEQCPLLAFGTCATAAAAQEIASELPKIAAVLHEQYPLTPLHSSPAELLH